MPGPTQHQFPINIIFFVSNASKIIACTTVRKIRIEQNSIKTNFSVFVDRYFGILPNFRTSFRREDMHL